MRNQRKIITLNVFNRFFTFLLIEQLSTLFFELNSCLKKYRIHILISLVEFISFLRFVQQEVQHLSSILFDVNHRSLIDFVPTSYYTKHWNHSLEIFFWNESTCDSCCSRIVIVDFDLISNERKKRFSSIKQKKTIFFVNKLFDLDTISDARAGRILRDWNWNLMLFKVILRFEIRWILERINFKFSEIRSLKVQQTSDNFGIWIKFFKYCIFDNWL